MASIRVIKDEIYNKEITRKNALMYERRKQLRKKKKYKYKKMKKKWRCWRWRTDPPNPGNKGFDLRRPFYPWRWRVRVVGVGVHIMNRAAGHGWREGRVRGKWVYRGSRGEGNQWPIRAANSPERGQFPCVEHLCKQRPYLFTHCCLVCCSWMREGGRGRDRGSG